MKTSERCIAAIKKFEGFRAEPYYDPAGVLTVGYGETRYVHPGRAVTEGQADLMLRGELAQLERELTLLVRVPLTQGEWDAVIDFAYNLGPGTLMHSALLKKLNQGDYAGAQAEFAKWTIAGGRQLPGLAVRRALEQSWFQEPAAESEAA